MRPQMIGLIERVGVLHPGSTIYGANIFVYSGVIGLRYRTLGLNRPHFEYAYHGERVIAINRFDFPPWQNTVATLRPTAEEPYFLFLNKGQRVLLEGAAAAAGFQVDITRRRGIARGEHGRPRSISEIRLTERLSSQILTLVSLFAALTVF